MGLLNNADEPKMPVTSPRNTERRRAIEARVAAMKADLPNQFPVDEKGDSTKAGNAGSEGERRRANLEGRFHEWLKGQSRKLRGG